MLSMETIKRVAGRHGLDFDNESCELLLADSYEGETVSDALIDYLNAWEGVSEDTLEAISNDYEAGATQ